MHVWISHAIYRQLSDAAGTYHNLQSVQRSHVHTHHALCSLPALIALQISAHSSFVLRRIFHLKSKPTEDSWLEFVKRVNFKWILSLHQSFANGMHRVVGTPSKCKLWEKWTRRGQRLRAAPRFISSNNVGYAHSTFPASEHSIRTPPTPPGCLVNVCVCCSLFSSSINISCSAFRNVELKIYIHSGHYFGALLREMNVL